MALIRYKKPTEYSFYKWIKNYPDSKYWKERIKKYPEVIGCPEINQFYRFIKTACKNRASSWLNWSKVETAVLKENPNFIKGELKILKNIFEHSVNFYKTPAIKQGYSVENCEKYNNVKKGNYIERGYAKGKFYEKEVHMNIIER